MSLFSALLNQPGSFFVVVERQIYYCELDPTVALVNLLASYYSFNICYPPSLFPLYHFIEHYVFKLPTSCVVPSVVTRIVSSVKSLL